MTRKNHAEEFVGIDIGSSSVKAVRMTVADENLRVIDCQAVDLPAPAISKDGELNRPAIIASLKTLQPLLVRNRRFDHVCVSIPGFLTTNRFATIPDSTNVEFRKFLNSEAGTYCDLATCACAAKILGDRVIPRSEGAVTRRLKNVFLLMVGKSLLDAFWEIMEEVGITDPNFSVDILGLVKALESSVREIGKNDEKTVLFHVGAQITIIAILRGTDLCFIRWLVNDPGMDPVANLVFEAGRSFAYFLEQSKEDKLRRILLSGGRTDIEALGQALSAGLGLPVIAANPLSSPEIATAHCPEFLPLGSRFSVAIGMGLLAFQAWFSGKHTEGLF